MPVDRLREQWRARASGSYILPALRDELLSHRHANADAAHDALVFPTSSGSRRDKDNAPASA